MKNKQVLKFKIKYEWIFKRFLYEDDKTDKTSWYRVIDLKNNELYVGKDGLKKSGIQTCQDLYDKAQYIKKMNVLTKVSFYWSKKHRNCLSITSLFTSL